HRAGWVNENLSTGTFGATVLVRSEERSRPDLRWVAGARLSEPMKGRPMMEYVQIPESLLADRPKTKAWVSRALEWASTLPPKVSPKGRKRSAEPSRSTRKR